MRASRQAVQVSSPGRRNEPPEKRGEIARLFRLGVSTVRAAARQAELEKLEGRML